MFYFQKKENKILKNISHLFKKEKKMTNVRSVDKCTVGFGIK